MKSVTCQASGERHRPPTPPGVRTGAFSDLLLWSCGTHATAATKAGRAQRAREPRQPTSCATGTLTPAASAALMPRAVEYTLVMSPMRAGNSRFTIPGRSTLPTAIAAPSSAVPRKSIITVPAERNRIPAASASRLTSSANSMPNARASRGAPGESKPNARSGSVVSRPATPLDTPVLSRISPIRGATEVSAGRRLAARSKSAATSSTPRRCEGPRRSAVSLAETFVMQTGYTAARARIPRRALPSLYTVHRLPLLRRRVGRRQVNPWRELEPEIRLAIDEELATSPPELEHVPTGVPLRRDEVEVVARHVQALSVVWEAEPNEAAGYVAQLEGGLVRDDLREGRVRLSLPGNAARPDILEAPVNADGVARGLAADEPVQTFTECIKVHGSGERP